MSSLEQAVQANLQAVHERITKAARRAGRDPQAIRLVAVSKTFPVAAIEAALAAGQQAFGENYVQEAGAKIGALAGRRGIEWHFIGPLQSNKTRAIAEQFDWVQSVDRLKVAERLSAQRPSDLPPLEVLLQVNISGEASKSGVEPDAVKPLATAVGRLPRLRLRGLMTVPQAEDDPDRQRVQLAAMRRLFHAVRPLAPSIDTLSMGMSGDLEAAIEEGATMVRIGTAIFGERQKDGA